MRSPLQLAAIQISRVFSLRQRARLLAERGLNRWWVVSLTCNAFRFATQSDQGMAWSLKRNCSVTPAQLGWLYASMCVLSLFLVLSFAGPAREMRQALRGT